MLFRPSVKIMVSVASFIFGYCGLRRALLKIEKTAMKVGPTWLGLLTNFQSKNHSFEPSWNRIELLVADFVEKLDVREGTDNLVALPFEKWRPRKRSLSDGSLREQSSKVSRRISG